MIESQTELPGQDRGLAAIWAKGRLVAASTAQRLRDKTRTWSGTRGAQRLRDFRPLVDNKARLSQPLDWIRAGIGDGSQLNRYALHMVVVLLAVGVVAFSQVAIPQVDLVLPTPPPPAEPGLATQGVVTQTIQTTNRGVNRLIGNGPSFLPAPVLHTTLSERDRMAIITYTVQANDNVWRIAQGFGLKAETVMWANPKLERSPDLLSVGQDLVVPPVDGVYYTVEKGDTVDKLAKEYQTTADKIISFKLNELEEPYALTPGQKIMLPDGRKKVVPSNYYPMTRVYRTPANAPKGSGRFAWPAKGILTQRYWSGHLGIDIGYPTGTPIYAADDGYVVLAGVDTWGYGNQVLIDHGNGYMTRYAHLHTIDVKAGQSVTRNQRIGGMGSTGRSTGPHLHFEIIYNRVRRNPLGFLP